MAGKLDKIVFYLLLGMTFVIPLLINPWGMERYEVDKIAIFCFLVDILVVIRLWQYGSFGNLWLKIRQVKLFSLEVLFGLLLVSYSISTLFSISVEDSLWGLIDRRFGLYTILHFVLFFLVIKSIKFKPVQVRLIAWIFVLNSFLISVYAILQKVGIEFLTNVRYVTLFQDLSIIRPMSSLGHPNYLGAFLVMSSAFIFYLLISKTNLWQKLLLYLVVLINTATLYLTLNRGGWLGSLVGILVFLVLYTLIDPKRKIKHKLVSYYFKKISLAFIVIIVFYSFFAGWWGMGGDIRSSEDLQQGSSMYVRMLEYKYSWQLIKENPIIGYGPETYIHQSVLRPRTENEKVIDDRYSDRVHNLWLDTWYSLGIIGLLILIAIYVKLAQMIWHILRKARFEDKKIAVMVTSSIVGYLVLVQLHFDTLITSFVLMILFSLIYDRDNANVPIICQSGELRIQQNSYLSVPVITICTIIILLGAYLNFSAIYLNTICDMGCFY